MKLMIVDDELPAREYIKSLLDEFFPEVEVCCEAENVDSACDKILRCRPDVLLLDIDLPDGNAFDLLKRFSTINFSIIFITAYEKFALQAIKFSALDYLLKPFTCVEFNEAIHKALKKEEEAQLALQFKTLIHNFEGKQSSSKIVLRTSESIHVIPTNDIIRLQAEGAYTSFFLINRKAIVVSKNIKEYDKLLENKGFIRSHQSHLVNSNHIVSYLKSDGGTLSMTDGSHAPVATRFKEKVIQQLEKL